MSFDFDGTGIDMDNQQFVNKLMPKGNYDYEIVEFTSKAGDAYPKVGTTKNGDPKVDFLAEVITPGDYAGMRVFHSVSFLPAKKPDGTPTPGAGMAVHFLKTIGQPFEGKFKVEPTAWVGARFKGYTIEDEYQGKRSNKIKGIEPIAATVDSGLPF